MLADKFYVASPDGTGKGVRPFAVYTSPTTINGVEVPAGTYLDGNLLATGSITGDKIRGRTIEADRLVAGTITAESGVIANLAVDTLQIADSAVTVPRIKYNPNTVQHTQSGSNIVASKTLITSASMDVKGGAIVFTVSMDELVTSSVDSSIPEKLLLLYRGSELIKTWTYTIMNTEDVGTLRYATTPPFAYEPPIGSHEYSLYLGGKDGQRLSVRITGTTLYMQGAKR